MLTAVGIHVISCTTTDHRQSVDERNAKILNIENHLSDQKSQASIQKEKNTSKEPLQVSDVIKRYEMRFL